jgi:DNA polymerase III delta prime subunit
MAISWARMPKEGVLLITGFRGEGKSALAWWLAQELKKKHKKPIAAFGVPTGARKALPKRVTYVDTLKEISDLKPSLVIIDEASFVANARSSMTKTNQTWLKLIAVCRHKGHLLIFINQHNRQLDIQIMMDADLFLLKRPTLLHAENCRPEFRTRLMEAYDAFQHMSRSATKRKVYVVDYHNGEAKMLPARMPTWWNDKISKAYAEVEVGDDE